jgi:hypothetical protein
MATTKCLSGTSRHRSEGSYCRDWEAGSSGVILVHGPHHRRRRSGGNAAGGKANERHGRPREPPRPSHGSGRDGLPADCPPSPLRSGGERPGRSAGVRNPGGAGDTGSIRTPTRSPSAAIAATWPARSTRRLDVAIACAATLVVSQSPTSPTGTLTRKMPRQPSKSISIPPTSGPAAMATPPNPAHRPIAPARCAGSGKACLMRPSEHGTSVAAPIPCRTRAAVSAGRLGATPPNRGAERRERLFQR